MTDLRFESLFKVCPVSHSAPAHPDPAAAAHANNPARWLVGFNLNDADSVAVAEQYRLRRGVPEANALGLDLPVEELITAA